MDVSEFRGVSSEFELEGHRRGRIGIDEGKFTEDARTANQ